VEHKGIHHLKEERLGGETQSCAVCVQCATLLTFIFLQLGHGGLHKNTFNST